MKTLMVLLVFTSCVGISLAQDWVDNFNGTNGWIITSGNYQIVGGRLCSNTDGSHILANTGWISTGTLDIDVEFNGGLGLAVYLRWRDNDNYIRCAISEYAFWVTECSNASPNNVYQGPISGYHDPHHIRVDLQEYNYSVYLDGILQYSGTWTFNEGGLKLESWGDPGTVDCYFDNVSFGNFSDDFTTYDHWYILSSGDWYVDEGRLVSHSDGSEMGPYFTYTPDPYGNVEANLEFDDGLGISLFPRFVDESNYLRCSISENAFWITECTNGVAVNVYQGPISGYHDEHHILVENRGDDYHVYLDRVMTYTGSWTQGTGSVKIMAWGYPGTVSCYADSLILDAPPYLSLPEILAPTIPNEYSLLAPYPNPFNFSITISYEVPLLSSVNISIYNLLGQRVEEVLNRITTPGVHNLLWCPSDYSSGIYFCRLQAGTFAQTRKLVLLK